MFVVQSGHCFSLSTSRNASMFANQVPVSRQVSSAKSIVLVKEWRVMAFRSEQKLPRIASLGWWHKLSSLSHAGFALSRA